MNVNRRLASLMIWWCEGTKTRKDKRWKNSYNSPIEVTNTNPKIIKIFIDFLRKDLLIPEKSLRGQIQIHDGDDKTKIEEFWSKVSGIPLVQFNKTIIRKRGNKIGKNYGTFKVRMYDKIVFKKIEELLQKELKQLLPGNSSVGRARRLGR